MGGEPLDKFDQYEHAEPMPDVIGGWWVGHAIAHDHQGFPGDPLPGGHLGSPANLAFWGLIFDDEEDEVDENDEDDEDQEAPIAFFCECSNADCTLRPPLCSAHSHEQ